MQCAIALKRVEQEGAKSKREGVSGTEWSVFSFRVRASFLSPHVGDCDCVAKAPLDTNCDPLGYCADVKLRWSSLPRKSISL